MNDAHARAFLRALLDQSKGRTAVYVPLPGVLPATGLSQVDASALLKDLSALQWIHVRGQTVAASKPAVAFAIDWTLANGVLNAILQAGTGGPIASVEEEAALAAIPLPRDRAKVLLNELILLGLVSRGLKWETQAPLIQLLQPGRDYLRTGQPPARID